MNTKSIKCLFIILLILFCYVFPNLSRFLLYCILFISVSIIGIYFGIKLNQKTIIDNYLNSSHKSSLLNVRTFDLKSDGKQKSEEFSENYFQTRTLVATNVDQLLEQIIDNCLRDFVFSWYQNLVDNKDNNQTIQLKLKSEFWEILSNIVMRMRSIDFLKFFTKNVVNRCLKHFQKITICFTNKDNSYALSSHLESKEKELDFIRRLSEFLLTILLPKNYSKSKPIVHLLREIISVQFLTAINLICDPIYLNQKLLDYLKWHKMSLERHKQIYAYSETYEQFVQMINKCCDIEDLKQIRFQIITEIMSATVINNLKKERGIDMNEKMFSGPITSAKGDQLQARNLKRYINQLTFAKNQCEKRIDAINGVDSDGQFEEQTGSQKSSHHLPQPNRKTVLGFRVIMDSDICRSYLKKFMQYSLISSSSTPEIRRHLIVFWESIEQLSKQDVSKQYEIANEILNNSNFKTNFIKLINLSKNTLKAMEEFVLGNRGSEAFFIAQNMVYEILEHRYYPLFIVSHEYEQMLDQIQDTLENSNEFMSNKSSESDESESDSNDFREQSLVNISDNSILEIHVFQTKQKLENLSQKLNDKRNALKALKKSETEKLSKSQINVNLKLIGMLEKETDDISREYTQFEAHLECIEMWISGMGKWSADVHNIELDHIDGHYLAIIIVHRSDITETSSNGWIVARNFHQFYELKRKLNKIIPNLKAFELPKLHKKSIVNDSQLKAIKQKLQKFLNFLTQNERIYRSEQLFLFLSQSSDNLRQPVNKESNPSSNKSKMFSFAKLFGITQTITPETTSLVDTTNKDTESDKKSLEIDYQFLILNSLEDEDNIKDDIAEPLYGLISEIFELRTISKWLRRSLMTFVQMTYGQTINKQLRSTVESICSESMIHYFLSSFRDSVWPNGTLSEPWPHSSDDERKRVQILAKQHLLNSIPEVLNNLLGQQNVRKGIVKIFDGLQNPLLNKQLFYELIETFMFEFAPELKSF